MNTTIAQKVERMVEYESSSIDNGASYRGTLEQHLEDYNST